MPFRSARQGRHPLPRACVPGRAHDHRGTLAGLLVLAACIGMPSAARGQNSAEEVAQTLANPAARVSALGGQIRLQPSAGDGRTNAQLRLQPVVPFALPDGWALLTRTILPISLNQWPENAFGLGDTSFNAYFVPPPRGPWFLAFGPSISLPTTTHRSLGSRNYAAGPTAIVARQGDPVTTGFLATQLWTVAMPEASPLRTTITTVQPFLAYNLGGGRTAALNSEITYNWELPAGRQWSVPISLGLTQVISLGDRFLQFGGGVTYHTMPRGDAGNWEFRINLTLVLPQG